MKVVVHYSKTEQNINAEDSQKVQEIDEDDYRKKIEASDEGEENVRGELGKADKYQTSAEETTNFSHKCAVRTKPEKKISIFRVLVYMHRMKVS